MSFYSIAPFIKAFYPAYYSIVSYSANKCICIRKVKDEWGVLSNFARTPLTVGGVEFKNSEQLFQLMKFTNQEPVMAVYQAANPKMTAKHWEKTHRREDWGKMIIDAMKFCLTTKYEQSASFRDTLLQTQGSFIVEDQTFFRKKDPDSWGVKLQGDNFVGPNLLGRLLMELRDKSKLTYALPVDAFRFLDFLK